jgi:hypothetical protein
MLSARVVKPRIPCAHSLANVLDHLATKIRGLRKKGVGRGIVVVFSDEPVRQSSLALTGVQQYKRSYYG